MEILTLIEKLEDIVEQGLPIPLFGRCITDKDELLDLIQEIRLKLPEEIKQAKWIKEERQRILLDAQKEANETLKDAESRINALIDEHELTKKAQEQAKEIITNAQKNAREIRLGTRDYADEILRDVENVMEQTLKILHSNRKELKR